ncbi:homoserine dehydrogenase [Chitinivibrio alkaliphilus]|uniref:Homoserine dehydrogenase n=1 Tax=Chitinivibrio alkaliphilus ACht1 TaxID=1313304 RepID=U7D6D2_9BACT|nr:homoserine dehydrogenase [Chitinivibrio alkaliphilus]ERP31131.1 homoserine dehydrogenase [Chitinivibrio alkaliphilus ACht1]
MDSINIAVLGAGTVGGGTIKLLNKQLSFFQKKLGLPLRLAYVAEKNTFALEEISLPADTTVVEDAEIALRAKDVHIVVELIGGTGIARELVRTALEEKKHVVTANKALIAHHGPELFSLAEKQGVSLYFEASVGGGMPTIKTIREALVGNEILSVTSIINGTCNYILSEMTEKGADFNNTLREAQRLGYAEADPTLDIEGGDTGHKNAIMASLLLGKYVSYDDMKIEGIKGLTAEDIAFAGRLGYVIKLVGIIKKRAGEKCIDARVHPVMLSNDHILANVSDVLNAVLFEGDAVGPVMVYGPGAGEMPTASAVVSDIVDVARNIMAQDEKRIPMGYYTEANKATITDDAEIESRYYLRFTVNNKPGVLGKIADTLATHGISIASVMQEENEVSIVSIVILTFTATEKNVKDALQEIEASEEVEAYTQLIRIED